MSDFSTASFRDQLWEAKSPCKQWNTGTISKWNCSINSRTTSRDVTP